MKKVLFTLCAVALLLPTGHAQNALQKGKAQVNLGFGIDEVDAIVLYGGLDYGIHQDITIGLHINYRDYTDNLYRESTRGGNLWVYQLNGNYHFNNWWGMSPDWDVYAGLNVTNYSLYLVSGGVNNEALLAGQIGGRYYINDQFALHAEVSGYIFTAMFGITFVL